VSERRVSLMDLAIHRGGIIKGARACAVVTSWALAVDALGHELGHGSLSEAVSEYADYWHKSERTAWRELGRFREVFGEEEESPARLATIMLAAVQERTEAKLASAPVLPVAA
jgi:hypothetical protein